MLIIDSINRTTFGQLITCCCSRSDGSGSFRIGAKYPNIKASMELGLKLEGEWTIILNTYKLSNKLNITDYVPVLRTCHHRSTFYYQVCIPEN